MIGRLLSEAWVAERAVQHRSDREGRLLDLPDHRIYAGVEPGSERRFVAIRLDAQLQTALKDRRPRSTRGIQTEHVVEPNGGVVFLREQPGIPQSVFPAVMEDVLSVATQGDRVVALRRAIERFNSWQSAFERQSGPLTAAEVRGMIGELITMRDLLLPAFGAQRSVEHWAAISSDEGLHDYAGESWALEAKSILSPGAAFHVSGTHQLQPDPGKKLWLCVVELETSDGDGDGDSLNSLVGALTLGMGPDQVLRDRFTDATIRRGMRRAAVAAEADVRYRVLKVSTFDVVLGFPVIDRAALPLAIDNVEYDVALVGCLNFAVPREQLVSALSQIEGLS